MLPLSQNIVVYSPTDMSLVDGIAQPGDQYHVWCLWYALLPRLWLRLRLWLLLLPQMSDVYFKTRLICLLSMVSFRFWRSVSRMTSVIRTTATTTTMTSTTTAAATTTITTNVSDVTDLYVAMLLFRFWRSVSCMTSVIRWSLLMWIHRCQSLVRVRRRHHSCHRTMLWPAVSAPSLVPLLMIRSQYCRYLYLLSKILFFLLMASQGWVFAVAKSIFASLVFTMEKPVFPPSRKNLPTLWLAVM